ncbi:hypothetical protein KVT40_004872 [Elsinoe batatas]|uniref:Uncharacterized protein n=1 Tax=Elsinoe batatas TaxID=2601811 RepID=A0A8K0PJ59_9PEZI|nr:hypothetical protein KVT40_004872 [Elsinoe batatas]
MKPVRKALKMAPLTLYLSFGIEVNAFNGLLTPFLYFQSKHSIMNISEIIADLLEG